MRTTLKRIYDLQHSKALPEAFGLANQLVTELEPQAKTLNEDLGYAYLARGEIHEDLNHYQEAIVDFEHTYFLWRDDTPDSGRGWLHAYDALTRAYAQTQRWSETLAMAERGLKTAEATPHGDHTYELHFHQRKIDALKSLDQKREAETALDVFKKRIPEFFTNDPSRRARWQGWIAGNYGKLGLHEKQLTALAEAGANTPESAGKIASLQDFMDRMALVNASFGAGNITEANRQADLLRDALPEIPLPEDSIKAILSLCSFYKDSNRYKDGLALTRTAEDIIRKPGKNDPASIRSILRWRNNFLSSLCRFQEAITVSQNTLELDRKEFGENSPEYIRDLKSHGHDLFFIGEYKEALDACREALAKAEKSQPRDDHLIVSVLGTIGFIITQSDEAAPTEAEAVLRRAIDLDDKLNGKLHPDSADDRINLATALMQLHRLDDAERCLNDALTCLKIRNGLDSDLAGWAYCQVSSLHAEKKEWGPACKAAKRAVEIRERIYGLQNFRTRIMLRQFISVAWEAGDKESCVERAEQLLASERADHGWTEFKDLVLCTRLAHWHIELNNQKRAKELNDLFSNASSEYYSGHKSP